MKRKNRAADLGIGALTGFAFGLAAGILYAPNPGIETRAMLKDKARAIRNNSRESVTMEEPETVKMVLVVNRGCIEPVPAE